MSAAEPIKTPAAEQGTDRAKLIPFPRPESPGEESIDRRRVHWGVCLAGAINQEARCVGPVQGERLTTVETEAVIADATERIRMLFEAGAPVTHGDLQSVATAFVRQAEVDKRDEQSPIR